MTTMNKSDKARKYSSPVSQELFNEITPKELMRIRVKLQLAARIEDFVRRKKWTNSEFATKLGKQPSEITKWFSGTQNFTIEVLTDIASVLEIDIFDLFSKPKVQIIFKEAYEVHSNIRPFELQTPIKGQYECQYSRFEHMFSSNFELHYSERATKSSLMNRIK